MSKLKIILMVLLTIIIGSAAFSSIRAMAESPPASKTAVEGAPTADKAPASTEIRLQMGNPVMIVNGKEQAIDESGTVPVIQNNRTLLPVRAIVEAIGGVVEWDSISKTVTLTSGDNAIKLTIGSKTAFLNEGPKPLDVAPKIIKGRTMLPIRFIAESFGLEVDWNRSDSTITITASESSGTVNNGAAEVPNVYMTTDISPAGLRAVYQALNREAKGRVAIKLHMGEPGGNNYLSPELVKEFVRSINGTFVDSNTAYGGQRASTALHRQVAKDHGFTKYAPVDILDADGSISLPVKNGSHLKEDLVGSHFGNYDFLVILSHFKGHSMGGFGGAIKNMSIGIASATGKNLIHTAGISRTTIWGGNQDDFLESMAEAAKAVADKSGDKILYINVMNNLSVDCDCEPSPAAPEMKNIGILASLDPVALDKASVDLVYVVSDGKALVERIESRNGMHTLDYAQKIGLGTQKYKLVNVK